MFARPVCRVWLVLLASLLVRPAVAQKPPLEFNRDIRPILADNCFACHGPDPGQRKGDLRLDTEADAFADRGEYKIIERGKPEQSELIKRITGTAKKGQMPPARFGKKLTQTQIDTLTRWVKEGATYQKHWSLIAPKRPTVPTVKGTKPNNPIDAFVLAKLQAAGMELSPAADPRTLARRLSFDLVGLPPTADEVEKLVKNTTPQAGEKFVDELLKSKHFGERMAVYWLDVVRYSDTAGYHSDNHRDVWMYRDYVIQAFNDNKRFDQFTIENLAGDLLPNATRDQRVASGYNRLLQTTEEGGAQPKEYSAKYAADRVRNTATAWLGLTMGCAECHDHKFDPITTKDFYRFASFFADVSEAAVGRQAQTQLPGPDHEVELKKIDARIAELQKAVPPIDAELAKWEEQVKAGKVKGVPKNITAILNVAPAKRNAQQKQTLIAHYRSVTPANTPAEKELAELRKQRDALVKSVPTSLVSMSGPPRMIRILKRGNWLDDSGEIVQPMAPEALPALPQMSGRPSRVDLAKWMVSVDNPLTARVFVNRVWKLYFGQGLVKTLDDLGSQGTPPSHPELLDWLAVEFRESGWDVKKLIKLIVTSDTYRQSSKPTEKLVQADPYNVLLGRQGRFRLDAEMVRDNALSVSGLLVNKIGGPSAKPYQPRGYWALLNFPTREWENDKDQGLYRRGLYTYWCRSFLHPSLLAFDAPTREECTVERPRSNTPQQALVLLNDPTYVEAARALAEKIMRKGGKDKTARVQFAFREVLQRSAQPAELQILTKLVEQHHSQYDKDRQAAVSLLSVGAFPSAKDLDLAELAAWTSVARVMLNLHETITRN